MRKEKTYQKRIKEFHYAYENKIKPVMACYEKKRKKLLILSLLLLIIPFIFLMIFSYFQFIEKHPIIMGITFFVYALAIPRAILLHDDFRMDLKYKCLPNILKIFTGMKWYSQIDLISDSEIKRSALFAPYNRRDSDDSFSGSYKDVKFKVCETKMYHVTGFGENRKEVKIFKGIIISFSANKKIENGTWIATKGDKTSKCFYWNITEWILIFASLYVLMVHNLSLLLRFISLGLIICFILEIHLVLKKKFSSVDELDEVKLEDPKFAKRFNVYSSDQVEARYLVTPSFMERFQNLNTAFGAKKAKCSFYDDKIMFAISTNKNLFEVGSIWRSLEDPKTLNQLFDELYSIYRMIDYFKLDQKIGL